MRLLAAACLLALAALAPQPAAAEVRFGRNVSIGGYDFSHRRYRRVTIRRVKRLPGPPGCVIDRRRRIERCNLPARR